MKIIYVLLFISLFCFNGIELICPPSYHSCGKNGLPQCIPRDWLCDHNADCEDASDEVDCKKKICSSDEFHCPNSDVCILKSQICDGYEDCLDHSDEKNCTNSPEVRLCDKRLEYDCLNKKKLECIKLDEVCSMKKNCSNNQNIKEHCDKNVCLDHKCSHICINKFSSYLCDCPVGMKLDNDNLTCVKINDCLDNPSTCQQECTLEKNGTICSCFEGYKKDGSKCVLHDPAAQLHLLYLSSDGLYDVSLFDGNSETSPKNRKLMKIDDKLIQFDASINGSNLEIFSSFVNQERVLSLNILNDWSMDYKVNRSMNQYKKTFSFQTSFFSIAADSVRNLVFWTDTNSSMISVFNVTNQDKTDIVTKDCFYPINIVLDPLSAKIFWIDLGKGDIKPRIMMAEMDGGNKVVLVDSGLRKPRSLAFDMDNQRLYWSDLFPGAIKYIDLNSISKSHKTINVLFETFDFLPCSLAVYKNRIYWSDCHQNRIYSIHKTSGKGLTTVVESVRATTIQIVSTLLSSNLKNIANDPKSGSFCSGVINKCSYSCLPTNAKNIVKCFGSSHQNVFDPSKARLWWLVLVPIVLLSLLVMAIFKFRNPKSKRLSLSPTASNVYVYDHVRFWDDDNNKKETIDDAQVVDVPDSAPIIQAV